MRSTHHSIHPLRRLLPLGMLAGTLLFSTLACGGVALKTKTAAVSTEVATMAEIQGVDHLGREFSSTEARKLAPLVVIFYRGHW